MTGVGKNLDTALKVETFMDDNILFDATDIERTLTTVSITLSGNLRQNREQSGNYSGDRSYRSGALSLAAVQPHVLKVLELSGFTSILKLYADVPAAVAPDGQPGPIETSADRPGGRIGRGVRARLRARSP